MSGMLASVWRYRNFIISSIRTEFRLRFARSRLGGLWAVLHPLTQVAMFAFVLSAVLSAKLPAIDNRFAYAIYLTAGMLSWSLFLEIVTRCLTIFIDNGNLLKKISFPRIALPLIVTGAALVNNAMLFVAIMLIFAPMGHLPSLQLLWLPVLMAVVTALGLGVGLVLGVLNVFMRDIGQVTPIMLQFLFWFTPIVYMPDVVPDIYRKWLALNPMYHVVRAYHSVLVFREPPRLTGVIGVAIAGMALLAVALFLFRKAAPDMVDAL